MTVRYYVDADTLGLAHTLVQLRHDVTYPGDPGGTVHKKTRPPCVIDRTDVPDEKWLPVVAAQGWAILTRDRAIVRRPHELKLVKDHGAKLFTITSGEKLSNWHMLEIVMCNWRKIDRLVQDAGPYAWAVTRTQMRPITL